ncbi:hypothetical protein KSP39_PZI001962 [Platanthera zijinensis]|uniref:Uncharacterized protein n=1 Tax=Platanthera zijinensis TaxID=2320716 RepID=A0AAP0BY79_9ASPA
MEDRMRSVIDEARREVQSLRSFYESRMLTLEREVKGRKHRENRDPILLDGKIGSVSFLPRATFESPSSRLRATPEPRADQVTTTRRSRIAQVLSGPSNCKTKCVASHPESTSHYLKTTDVKRNL